MLLTASTFIRAVDVGMLGIKTISEPSLGVLAVRIVGNVLPPSIESEILTLAAFPLAFQVTLRLLNVGIITAIFGAVTAKGLAAPSIATTALAVLIPPP